ncbi:MAG: TolC family protein [Sedimenticola sp.]
MQDTAYKQAMSLKIGQGLLLALIMIVPGWLHAQQTGLVLEDVVQQVLRENPQLQIGRQQVLHAEALHDQADGQFDWGVYANAGLERRYVPVARGDLLTSRSELNSYWTTQIGVRKQFQNGVSIGPGVVFYSGSDGATEAADQAVSRPMVNLNIPLMRGAGKQVVMEDSNAAAGLVEAARADGQHAAAQVLTSAVIAYWKALAAAERLSVLERAEIPAADFVASLQQLVEQGESPPALHDQARADLMLRRLEIGQASSELHSARRQLAAALGSAGFEPQVAGQLPQPGALREPAPVDDALLTRMALERRPDLVAMKQRLQAQDIRLLAARDQLRPKVDLSVDFEHVMLHYEQSLGKRAAKGGVAQKQANLEELRLQLQQRERQVHAEVGDALALLRGARRDSEQAIASVALYRTLVEEARRKVRLGEAVNSEYTLMQDRLARSHAKEIAVRLQYVTAVASLRLATGTTGIEQADRPALITQRFRAWNNVDEQR